MARVRRKTYKKKCANCGKIFTATRRDAKYHSAYCRTDNWRMRKERAKISAAQNHSPILEYQLKDERGLVVPEQIRMIRINGRLVPR